MTRKTLGDQSREARKAKSKPILLCFPSSRGARTLWSSQARLGPFGFFLSTCHQAPRESFLQPAASCPKLFFEPRLAAMKWNTS